MGHLSRTRDGFLPVWAAFSLAFITLPAVAQAEPLQPLPAASLAFRAGLTVDTLAVAAVTTTQFGGILEWISEDCVTNLNTLTALDAEISQLRLDIASLEHVVRSGAASPEQVAGLATAITDLAGLCGERMDLLADVRAEAISGLDSQARIRIELVHANRCWELPSELLVVERTEAEWHSLATAWHGVNAADHLGQSPASGSQTIVVEAMSDPLAVEAAGRLVMIAPQLQSTLNAFLTE